MPCSDADHRQSGFRQAPEQPLRHGSGFEPDARQLPRRIVERCSQTTSIISLKRSVSTKSGDRGSRPNIPSVSLLMQLRRRFCLVSQSNQRRGVSSLFKIGLQLDLPRMAH
jgi:hypothetical protein